MSVPNFNKYKERISQYEDPDNPLAPLTASQRQFIIDITHAETKPRATNLPSIPQPASVQREQPASDEAHAAVDLNAFKFNSQLAVSDV